MFAIDCSVVIIDIVVLFFIIKIGAHIRKKIFCNIIPHHFHRHIADVRTISGCYSRQIFLLVIGPRKNLNIKVTIFFFLQWFQLLLPEFLI